MNLLAYRHGLRASELCSLRWDMLDLAQGRFHVTRRKSGRPSMHLIRGTEIRDLRRLKREQVPKSIYVFVTERRGSMTPATFPQAPRHDRRRGRAPLPVHPHMPRHGCGFALAHGRHDTRAIQEWLGRRNIQHTTRYTEFTTHGFKGFWEQENWIHPGFSPIDDAVGDPTARCDWARSSSPGRTVNFLALVNCQSSRTVQYRSHASCFASAVLSCASAYNLGRPRSCRRSNSTMRGGCRCPPPCVNSLA